MHRRTFLAGSAATLSLSVAGCSALEPPPETSPATVEPSASATATSTPTQYERRFLAFRSRLDEREIQIVELIPTDEGLIVSLEYITQESAYQEIGGEIGQIAGEFFQQIAAGWSAERLESVVFQDEDTPYGSWHAEAAWYREFEAGDLTGEQLSLRVLETLDRA